MLSIMRKTLCSVIVLLCCLSECPAQSRWVLPKLQELTDADAIGRGSAQLSTEEVSLLKNLTSKVVANCLDDPGLGDPRTAIVAFKRMRVRRVPLTSHGDSGLVVQGSGVCMCGAVGNCLLWVIGEQPRPLAILHAVGIQSFAFRNSATANRFDLVLGTHDSASATHLQRFRFDGRSYKRADCALLEWADPMGNVLHPPTITPERCP